MYLARYLMWFQCLQRPLVLARLEEAAGSDSATRNAETASYPSAWLSLALPLRALAQDCLLHHLRAQREQTLEILNDTGGIRCSLVYSIVYYMLYLTILIFRQVSRKFLTKMIG